MFSILLYVQSAMVAVWSLIVNSLYWAWHIRSLKKTIHEKRIIAHNLRTVRDVVDLLHGFKWRADKFGDWSPWIVTIINNKISDDCDGSSVLARWAFECIGKDARILSLWKKWSRKGHAVCVTCDNEIMVSNDTVVTIIEEDWEKWVLDWFDNKYDMIIGA